MQQPRAYRRIPRTATESGLLADRIAESGSAAWESDAGPISAPASSPHAAVEIRRRVHAALGPHPDPDAAQRLETLYHVSLAAAGAGCATRWWGPRSVEQVFLRILGRL